MQWLNYNLNVWQKIRDCRVKSGLSHLRLQTESELLVITFDSKNWQPRIKPEPLFGWLNKMSYDMPCRIFHFCSQVTSRWRETQNFRKSWINVAFFPKLLKTFFLQKVQKNWRWKITCFKQWSRHSFTKSSQSSCFRRKITQFDWVEFPLVSSGHLEARLFLSAIQFF